MSILIDICLGLLLAWAFKSLKGSRKGIAAGAVISMISCVMLFMLFYADINADVNLEAGGIFFHALIMLAVLLLYFIFGKRIAEAIRTFENNDAPDAKEDSFDEEDYMKTRNGKIMLIICIILVIYMIASAFCIYKLNQKVNSIYEITQELKEDR